MRTGGIELWPRSLLISALNVGECSGARPDRFAREKYPPLPIEQEDGCAPEPVCKLYGNEKSLASAENRIQDHNVYTEGIWNIWIFTLLSK